MTMFVRWLGGLALALGAGLALSQLAVPPLTGRVVDLAGVLEAEQKGDLERRLAAFEAEKGSQIAVLVVPTTQPEPIEAYSIRVVEEWKLGRQGIDDGLLVLLAVQDRAVRIEVGRGLEGAIPDAVAKRVIEEVMLPQFRQGNLYAGLAAGIDKILGLIRGEPLPPPRSKRAVREDGGSVLGAAIAGSVLAGYWLKWLLGPLPAALVAAGGVAGIAAIAGLPLLFALLLGLFVFAFVLVGASSRPNGWYSGSKGFGQGGWGHTGFGGGFRGGGGGFSGGGASGRW
ncbi:MAG: TPM domain-containing protein [Methylohalobius sp.]|nr:TPM domain-containing protein [Methylohalobius sp.]